MNKEIIYPIGDSSFSTIRSTGQFYVDKTAYIHRMAASGKYFFLSRPRRFGKSLLVSTMEAYFSGRRELFSGLAIDSLEQEWRRYPVLRLDLSMGDMSDPAWVETYLRLQLSEWEKIYGKPSDAEETGARFIEIIRQARKVAGEKAVILIDEYDNPLFSTYEDPAAHERNRTLLKGVYSVLKGEAENIRFCFLTGVTRFSKMSVFSGINNLRDITLSPEYSGICGITQEELERDCAEGIRSVARANGLTEKEAVKVLKDHYDGYHFGDMETDVYNPFSLIQVFPRGEMDDYWFVSGTSEFLWKRISDLADTRSLLSVLNPVLEKTQLGSAETDGMTLEALLFQTGYLTLKERLEDGWAYRLGIPNREVSRGIYGGLLPLVASRSRTEMTSEIVSLRKLARTGDVDAMMERIRSFMAGITYRLTRKMPEIYYENNLYILFKLLGIRTEVEMETADGRMDITMEIGDYIYILELKLDRPASEAIAQIEDKKYWLPFSHSGKKIVLVGVSFSSESRNVASWVSRTL